MAGRKSRGSRSMKRNTRRKDTRRKNTRRKNTRRKNTRRKDTRRKNTRRNTRKKDTRRKNTRRNLTRGGWDIKRKGKHPQSPRHSPKKDMEDYEAQPRSQRALTNLKEKPLTHTEIDSYVEEMGTGPPGSPGRRATGLAAIEEDSPGWMARELAKIGAANIEARIKAADIKARAAGIEARAYAPAARPQL